MVLFMWFMYANYPHLTVQLVRCIFIMLGLIAIVDRYFPPWNTVCISVCDCRKIGRMFQACSEFWQNWFFSWYLAKLSGEVGKNTNCSSLAILTMFLQGYWEIKLNLAETLFFVFKALLVCVVRYKCVHVLVRCRCEYFSISVFCKFSNYNSWNRFFFFWIFRAKIVWSWNRINLKSLL